MKTLSEDEIWKPCIGFEGLYEVSNLGIVKSLARNWETGVKTIVSKPDTILALHISKSGYFSVCLNKNGKRYSLLVHRLVWESFNGKTDLDVLHNVEGNKLDCRLSNLHIGTDRQNHAEYRLSTKKTSKYVGVCWDSKKKVWVSAIFFNKKQTYIGSFKTEIEAHNAYVNKLNSINKMIKNEQ